MRSANIMKVDRLRMGTDGQGITTLVAFYKCPLKCKYCINHKCHFTDSNSKVSAIELYNSINIDQMYFSATGGGLTFGGGEPLLQASFILDVLELGAKNWHTTIETSLNVPYNEWYSLIDYVNEWIIDIKDMNPSIYKCYTSNDNAIVIDNLKKIVDLGLADRVLIRLPLIKGFNTEADVRSSYQELEQIGFSRFDKFSYKIVK